MLKFCLMDEDEREKLREYVNRQRETGEFLEKLRREEIRNSNLAESTRIFDDAFRSALWLNPAEKFLGLVEFHKILAKSK